MALYAACAIPVPVVDPIKLSRKRTSDYIDDMAKKFSEKLSESAIKQRKIEIAEEEKHLSELAIKNDEEWINRYIDKIFEAFCRGEEVVLGNKNDFGNRMLNGTLVKDNTAMYIAGILDKRPNISKTVRADGSIVYKHKA